MPIRTTSIPDALSPSTSACSSMGELTRPSYPTATFLPPASASIVPKPRPMARASSAPKVSPMMPRMSYSRRTVG